MRQQEPGLRDPNGPLDWRKLFPFDAVLSSVRLGWVGLEAARCRAERVFELHPPAITHHWLVLFLRPPGELDLRYEGVKRHVPPPAGAISLVPAGSPARGRWGGPRDLLAIYLESGLVAQVAAEAFGLDPARLTVPPLDSLELPHLRAAMGASGRRVAGQRSGRPPDPPRPGPPTRLSAGRTARCHGDGSAPSSSTSRSTSTPARPWTSWPPWPA